MNTKLLEEIVKHIYASFLIIPNDFFNPDTSQSIIAKEFMLDKKLDFEDEDGQTKSNSIWGAQMQIQGKTIKVLCGDCSLGFNKEYALLVSHGETPMYGLFSVFNFQHSVSQDALIAVSTNGNAWLECTTLLQASFLAAMEQLKEFGFAWQKCENYKQDIENLKSFIKYHDALFQ